MMKLFGWKKTALTLNRTVDLLSEKLSDLERWKAWLTEQHECMCAVYKEEIKTAESINKILDERCDALVKENEEIIAELEQLKQEYKELTAERDWLSGEVKWFREKEGSADQSPPQSAEPTAPPQGAAKDNPLSLSETAPPDQVEPTWAGGMTGDDDDELPFDIK